MGEYKDGFAWAFLACLLQPSFQLIYHILRIGGSASGGTTGIVAGTGAHTDGDEGIALDDFVLMQGVKFSAIEVPVIIAS